MFDSKSVPTMDEENGPKNEENGPKTVQQFDLRVTARTSRMLAAVAGIFHSMPKPTKIFLS